MSRWSQCSEISEKHSGMNVAKLKKKFEGILDKFWMKFIGNLKLILNKILGILGKNFENFWKNVGIIISKI